MGRRELLDPIAFKLSVSKLQDLFKINNPEELFVAIQSFLGRGYYDRIAMSQKKEEFLELIDEVRKINPETIVEIGTRKGGTLFSWCRLFASTTIISIDLPGGIHGGGYHPRRQKFYRKFVADRKGSSIYLFQQDSHDLKTLDSVINVLDGVHIDFLFIDGDHTYQGVKQDFELYSPLVKKGGLIAFHDIIENKTEHEDAATIEVPKFWNEVKRKYEYKEFFSRKGQLSMGIGVIVKD